MKHWKGLIQNGAVLLLITLVISCILVDTSHSINQMLSDSVHQTLNEVSQQQSFSFSRGLHAEVQALKNISLTLSPQPSEGQAPLLAKLRSNSSFCTLILADAEGSGINDRGERSDFTASDVYRRAMLGEEVIVPEAESQSEGSPVISIALPVYYGQDSPQGVLIGGCSAENLYTLMPPFFEGDGITYLVSQDGKRLLPPETDDIFFENFMDHVKPLDGNNKSRILSDMAMDRPGHTIFELDGERWHCHYNPAGIEDWYIFTIVRFDVGASYASSVSFRFAAVGSTIIICFLLCLGYIIYEQRKHTAAMEHAAFHDDLCNCPNLAKFKLNVQDFINMHPDGKMAMVKFDIREFKLFNQIFGVESGNQILTRIAGTLRQMTPPGCYCRAHDDEFYALIPCGQTEELHQIHESIQKLFYEYIGKNSTYQFNVAVGCYYMHFENCRNAAEGTEKANVAHRKARELNQEICVYDEEFVQQALWRKQVENRLDGALANNEFIVYLQAQYALPDETVSSAEALVRWKSETDGLLMPGSFIPILENDGLITKLDYYVWEKVCIMLREWIDAGIAPIEIAVNFSRKHLVNPNFINELCEIADRYRVPHRLLAIELTESIIWENEKILIEMTTQLHEHGFLLSLDDFGTGYSSLSLLKNLPVDILKIDRSFFTNNRYKTRAKQLITSVMKMAEQLNMITVAEGVEQLEHVNFLREVGCNKIQGYYFERPTPSRDFWKKKETSAPATSPADQPVILKTGDVKTGRSDMGETMPVAVFRLYQCAMREALTQRYGDGEMHETLQAGGWLAGRSFARESLNLTAPFHLFLEELRQALMDNKIGLLEIEEASEDGMQMVFAIRNDLDCSGMEDTGTTYCQYDEGFIGGVLYEYTKNFYSVVETDCWGNGADVCRFSAKIR